MKWASSEQASASTSDIVVISYLFSSVFVVCSDLLIYFCVMSCIVSVSQIKSLSSQNMAYTKKNASCPKYPKGS